VAPSGNAAGPGTWGQPYDLRTALTTPVAQPGDTFWMRRGTYTIGHVVANISGAAGKPITFREVPGDKARVDGSLTFYETYGHVVLRDFELYSSDTNRLSSQHLAGFNPTDITIIPGISSYVPNMSFINLVVHDQTRHGFYISEWATNNLVYGCLVYNNGWASPDDAEGHSFYIQSDVGTRTIADNVAFNAAGANFHVYENATNLSLVGITLDGNVAFNAGALQAVRTYRDWLVGVDAPATGSDGIVFVNNMGYYPLGSTAFAAVQVGRAGVNGSLVLSNNYLPQGLLINNWTNARVTANVVAGQTTNFVVSLNQTQTTLSAHWDSNMYWCPITGLAFQFDSTEFDFPGWQGTTGYDTHSTYNFGALTGTRIFIRPNRYEPGRANVIVYNWDNLSNVTVDVSSVLTRGAAYELRNAQDFFAAPVLSGIYDGQPLRVPMPGLTVAAPNGPLLTPPPTGPTFNVFLLLPPVVRLELTATNNQAQFSWPTNVGAQALQFSTSLATNASWVDDTNLPVVAGDLHVVTNHPVDHVRFYRLQAR
jgi:hypothetical protein